MIIQYPNLVRNRYGQSDWSRKWALTHEFCGFELLPYRKFEFSKFPNTPLLRTSLSAVNNNNNDNNKLSDYVTDLLITQVSGYWGIQLN